MSSLPKVCSANATIASQSFALEMSAENGTASPPAALISSTVPPAPFKSATTTFAPSCAKRRHDAMPMPDPPPVINATLFANRISPHLEISAAFPIGDHRIELSLFRLEEMQVVPDHVVAERRACERA